MLIDQLQQRPVEMTFNTASAQTSFVRFPPQGSRHWNFGFPRVITLERDAALSESAGRSDAWAGACKLLGADPGLQAARAASEPREACSHRLRPVNGPVCWMCSLMCFISIWISVDRVRVVQFVTASKAQRLLTT